MISEISAASGMERQIRVRRKRRRRRLTSFLLAFTAVSFISLGLFPFGEGQSK
jgi:cell division protein FtsB